MTTETRNSLIVVGSVAAVMLWTAMRPSDMDCYVEELIREGNDLLYTEGIEAYSKNARDEELLDKKHAYDVARMDRFCASDRKYEKESERYERRKKEKIEKGKKILLDLVAQRKQYEKNVRDAYARYDKNIHMTKKEEVAWRRFLKNKRKLSGLSNEDYNYLQEYFLRATHTESSME